MGIIRAMAVLKHQSGLARDNIVNTFHFNGDQADPTVLTAIYTALINFYAADPPGYPGQPLGRFLSGNLTALDIHQYVVPGTLTDGRETPTGPPIRSDLGSSNGLSSIGKSTNVNLPQEVAVCVSYQGTPEAGLIQRRRRGRIYVGPFNTGVLQVTSNAVPRPSQTLRDVLSAAMVKLIADVDPKCEFVVYSRPFAGRPAIERVDKPDLPAIAARPGTTVNVDQIWVDDEFDTQRRRGLQRTGRTLVTTA